MRALVPLLLCVVGQPITVRHDAKAPEIVARIPGLAKQQIPVGPLAQEEGEAWLRLCLLDEKSKTLGPAMLGKYERKGDDLIFRPRFALEPGAHYRAVLGPADKAIFALDIRVPPRQATPTTRVEKIYPSSDVLPANHLRFYIHFSQPMRGGEDIFRHFAILDDQGDEVLSPWLTDELWDETGQILILYIHPGRIKWGVLLRELLGPVLLPERRYLFVVRGALLDAQGQKLGKDMVKGFRTSAENRTRIELSQWKLETPRGGTQEPLVLRFPTSLDHKSLERLLTVHKGAGAQIEGKISIGPEEKSWSFEPKRAWSAGEHKVVVDRRFEDSAGNTPMRPFDVDMKATPPPAQALELAFRPR